MIDRVRDRATFEALRRSGRRVRRGPVTVVYLAADTAPPRAAFAVGRSVGNAVVRNKVRRRLRSILRDIDAGGTDRSGLAPGSYLVTTRPEIVDVPYAELSELVRSACAVAWTRSAGDPR